MSANKFSQLNKLLSRAYNLDQKGQYAKSEKLYQEGMQIDVPEYCIEYLKLANNYISFCIKTNQPDTAIKIYERIKDHAYLDPLIYYNMACVYTFCLKNYDMGIMHSELFVTYNKDQQMQDNFLKDPEIAPLLKLPKFKVVTQLIADRKAVKLKYKIDKRKIKASLKDKQDEIKKLLKLDNTFGIFQQFKEDFEDALESYDNYKDLIKKFIDIADPEYQSEYILALLLIVENTFAKDADILLSEKHYNELENNAWLNGNVTVQGNFVFDKNIYITGNLIIDGIIICKSDYNYLIASGNIKAKSISCTSKGNRILAGKSIELSEVALAGSDCRIIAGSTLTANLAIESETNPALICAGTMEVKHFFNYEAMEEENDNNCPKLSKILVDKAFDKYKNKKVLWGINLSNLLLTNKPYLK